jgi:hypothetical protein
MAGSCSARSARKAVLDEAGHQGWGDRLPADRLALLPQQDQALLRVQIPRPQRQRATAPAGRLGVEPQQQGVQLRIVARSRGDLVDLCQPDIRQRPPGSRQAPRLSHLPRRYRQRSAATRCSSALRPPRALRRATTWVLT